MRFAVPGISGGEPISSRLGMAEIRDIDLMTARGSSQGSAVAHDAGFPEPVGPSHKNLRSATDRGMSRHGVISFTIAE